MKKLFTGLLAVCMLLSLVGCAGTQQSTGSAAPAEPSSTPVPATPTPTPTPTPEIVQVNVAALKGPTGMGMSALMEAAEQGKTANDYTFTLSGAPDEVSAAVVSGAVDIAAVPINLAAVLSAKTGNVKLLAVNTLGVLYILEKGDSVQSIGDLAGKKLLATGQASTPEYILSYILEKNGLTDSVEVEYLTEHSELAALMASGEAELGMLPQPNVTVVTVKNPEVRVALDLTEEWNAVTGTELVQGCIIVRADFAEAHPEAVEAFLKEYAESVETVNADHAAAAELISKFGIVENAAIAEKAIEKCHIVCLTGDALRQSADAMFRVLFEANPKSVGGALPDESIYY